MQAFHPTVIMALLYSLKLDSPAYRFNSSYYLGLTMLTLTPDLVIALGEQYAGFPPDCDHGVIVQS